MRSETLGDYHRHKSYNVGVKNVTRLDIRHPTNQFIFTIWGVQIPDTCSNWFSVAKGREVVFADNHELLQCQLLF